VADENGKASRRGENDPGSEPATRGGDAAAGAPGLKDSAARVLENLGELEPELVSAGIFDADRELIVSTSDSSLWAAHAAGLLEALEAGSGDETFDSAHVAAADGEVFVVSESGLWLVAVTGRFVLASLTSYDMRMALRDVARGEENISDAKPRKVSPEAKRGFEEDA
jgi:hypothetical protein